MTDTTATTLRSRAPKIAEALGAGWTVAAPRYTAADHREDSLRRQHDESHVQLVSPEGMTVHVSTGGYQLRNRIEVSLSYPADARGEVYMPYRNEERADSITIADSKTDAQIARDILRRFVASALPVWTAQIARVHAAHEFFALTKATATAINKAIGGGMRDADNSGYHDAARANRPARSYRLDPPRHVPTVTVSGDHVSFDVRTDNPELAIALLKMIAVYAPAADQDGGE